VTVAGQDLGGAVAGPAADGVGAVYVASWRQGADVGEAGFRLAAIPTSPGTFDLDGRTNLGYERVRSADGDRYWLLHGAVLTLSAQGTGDGDDVAGSFAGVRYRADAWGL